jgi:hypothetical protein
MNLPEIGVKVLAKFAWLWWNHEMFKWDSTGSVAVGCCRKNTVYYLHVDGKAD